MVASRIIIILLWFGFSAIAAIEYAPFYKDLSIKHKFFIIIIFAIGGPIFALNNVLTSLLDCILPEGWDNDEY